MALSYTVDSLIDSARRRGHLPEASGRFDTADLVELMNEELQTYIMSYLIAAREEYALDDFDFAMTPGTAEYPLPPRAIGGKIRKAYVLCGSSYQPLQRLELDQVSFPVQATGAPRCYYWDGTKIGLSPCGDGSIRVKYFRRPGKLVLEEDAAQITAINIGTKTVMVSNIPVEWVSGTYDIVAAQPMFDTLAEDQSCVVAGSNITFANTLPTNLAVGDWVALAGESPIPQIPAEVHTLLAQRTAAKVLEATDPAMAGIAASRALAEENRLTRLLVDDRDGGGSPRYIINRNGPGWRYGGRIRY